MTALAARRDADRELDARLLAFEARLTGAGAPFELMLRPDGARRFASGPGVLGDVYRRAARMGDKALVATMSERWSYAKVMGDAHALSAALVAEGYGRRRIALLIEDGPQWLVWFVAITAAGATCVLPPPGATPDVAARCLAAANCAVAVVEPSRGQAPGGIENLHGLRPRAESGEPTQARPDDEVLISFTSGSSGEPKGVVHSHRSLLSGLRNMMLAGALSSQMLPPMPVTTGERPRASSTLVLSPLSYIAGCSAFLLALITGGRLVLATEADGAESVTRVVQTDEINAISGASVDFIRRLLRRDGAAEALRSLRRLQLHGSLLHAPLVQEIGAALPQVQVMTGYGMSETAGSITGAPVQRLLERIGGCGRLVASVDLRVVDDAGRPLPPGAVGHIEVRGDMVMQGYLDDARTARAFTPDGWFRCGDMGALGEGRWLRVLDRSERRLGSDPDRAFISQIEEVVRGLTGVDDAAVAASTDGDGLVVYAQVSALDVIDPSALGIAAAVAGLSRSIEVRLVEALPRTATGKIDRRSLERLTAKCEPPARPNAPYVFDFEAVQTGLAIPPNPEGL